ncbi:MAG: choice-of-anchor D domain-containing protein [Deltaproteobacteria bacterium]|nr:choice-of-anchor D domain-containing protein [Deltaproteobacteria bacterium]
MVCTVIGVTIAMGAPAPGDNYEITDWSTTTRGRIPMAITRSVLSIRNISSAARTFSLVKNPMAGGCMITDAVRIGTSSAITNVTLQAGEQTQFETSSLGSGAPVSQDCTWTIQELVFAQQFDTSHTYLAVQSDSWDLQPRNLSFRPTLMPETQTVYVQNYTSSAQSYGGLRLTQTAGAPGSLAISGAGPVSCADDTCEIAGATVAANAFAVAQVSCTLFDTNPVMGRLELIVANNVIQSTPIACQAGVATPGIALMPSPLILGNPTTASVTVTATGTASNAVIAAELIGDADFVFDGAPCSGIGTQNCSPMGGATTTVALPIRCTPDSMTRTAMLRVTPAMGVPVMSVVQCTQTSTGGPMLLVSPTTVPGGSRAVGASHTESVTLINSGAGTLDVHVVPPPSAEWTVTGCPVAAPCSLVGNGSNTTVTVTFTPAAHDDRSSSMLVVANGGSMMQNVTLAGSGTGAVLVVTQPTAGQGYTLELGTVGLNTPRTQTIQLRNNGNVPTNAMIGMTAGAPFTLSATAVSLPANPGMDSQVTVTCQSAIALEETRMITIQKAANAYRAEPAGLFDQNGSATISAHCKVVNTAVQISPELAFGEVWKGSDAVEITTTIRNPSSALLSARVTGVSLVGGTQGLTLGPLVPAVSFPHMLAPGESLMTTLTLATAAEVDVGTARLLVMVDGVDLEQPISGKVVTPSARLAPAANLDLGTACIGSDVRGTVMLVNDGTATLTIMRPQMDGAFTPTYVDPSTYSIDGTALLAPARSAIASVRPNMSAGPGRLEGTLTWNVAGPGPFTIDVFLSYISAGAAVSPGALSFGPVSVDQISNRQTITLENCNPTPIDVAVQGVKQRTGDVRAWDVQPRVDTRTLAPEEKMTISVAFAPTRSGRHAADLQLIVGDEPRIVPLEADGVGVTIDRSSFYACSCQGGRTPMHGWPVVVALVLLCVPRRRRR